DAQQWDDDLLDLLDIPKEMLPEVHDSSEMYGTTKTTIFAHEVPTAGIAGDQQSAMFGQICQQPSILKHNYSTGSYIMFSTGDEPILSVNNLLSTIGWRRNSETTYALEGSIFIAGAVVQWLRDELNIINESSEVEELASSVDDNGGVYMVPAFTGL